MRQSKCCSKIQSQNRVDNVGNLYNDVVTKLYKDFKLKLVRLRFDIHNYHYHFKFSSRTQKEKLLLHSLMFMYELVYDV